MMQSATVLCGLLATTTMASPVNRAARAVCSVEVEAESTNPSAGWVKSSAIGGASDNEYLTWTGGNHFAKSQAGKFGLLSYSVTVPASGTYKLSIRNIHGHDDPTEGNDAWVRVGTSSPWLKVFNNVVNKWNYVTFIDPAHGCSWNGLPDCEHPTYTLSAGVNTVQVSGRSKDFSIDTIKLDLVGQGCSAEAPAPAPAPAEEPAPAPAPAPSPTPALQSGSFEALNADGVGCCRFDDSDANSGGDNYQSLASVMDEATCQAECKANDKCMGYELSQWEGCELHYGVPSHATSTVGCTCMKKVSEPDALVTEAPVTEAPLVVTEAPVVVTEAPVVVVTEPPAAVLPGTLSAEAIALAQPAGNCAVLPGYDFAGYDFAEILGVLSVEQCAEMCLANPACAFFTRTKWNGCYLKSVEAGYNAPVQAGVANVWGDTGRCSKDPTEDPTETPTDDGGSGTAVEEEPEAEEEPGSVEELESALSAAEQASASYQAENAELSAENEQLRATLEAIKALVA